MGRDEWPGWADDVVDPRTGTAHYFSRAGEPISFRQWSERRRDEEHLRVAVTEVGDVMISTVWIGMRGLSHPDGPPLIFETIVFGGPLNLELDRYPTEVQAIAGHDQMVARVREGCTNG